MVVVTAISSYVLMYSTQNKPYVLDIVCVLVLVLVFQRYRENRLSFRYFCLITLLLMLTSFASYFIPPILGLLMLMDYYKTRKRIDLNRLLIWTAILLLTTLAYYFLFLRQQILANGSLDIFWDKFLYMGSMSSFLKNDLINIKILFGFNPNVSSGFLNNISAWWLNQSIHLKYSVVGIEKILAYLYLILFLLGNWYLFKARKHTFLIVLYGMLFLEFIAALFRLWPFGGARTNLFSIYLISIVPYFAISTLLQKLKGVYLQAFLLLIFIVGLITFPYSYVYSALLEKPSFVSNITTDNMGMADEKFAEIIAKSSKQNDLVLIDFYSDPLGFQYYYKFSDYTREYPDRTKDVNYSSNKFKQLYIPNYLYEPGAKLPKDIWVIMGPPTSNEKIPSVITSDYHINKKVQSYSQVLEEYSL
jgi:hypothetical protein